MLFATLLLFIFAVAILNSTQMGYSYHRDRYGLVSLKRMGESNTNSASIVKTRFHSVRAKKLKNMLPTSLKLLSKLPHFITRVVVTTINILIRLQAPDTRRGEKIHIKKTPQLNILTTAMQPVGSRILVTAMAGSSFKALWTK